MIEIKNKLKCSGCHGCMNVCPKKCITMEIDEEGFWYPQVDKNKCISCNLCEQVCPILNDMLVDNYPKAYACLNKDEKIRKESSSGGIFTLLASEIIDQGGVVYGAAFNSSFEVEHIQVSKKEDLNKLRGSKYVQSKLGDTYAKVKKMLNENKLVYFSGTPCQIDGLLSFLGTKYDNLICQDIVCHGVPSPKVWKYYLKQFDLEKDAKINFRDKCTGWSTYSFTINQKNKFTQLSSNNSFMKAFLRDLCLRPSCYACHSKSLNRNSDITLADFWGINDICPEMYDDKGVSLVFVNSIRGNELFYRIKEYIKYEEVDIEKASSRNPAAYKSVSKPKKRDEFMKHVFRTNNFNKFVDRITKPSINERIRYLLNRMLKRL